MAIDPQTTAKIIEALRWANPLAPNSPDLPVHIDATPEKFASKEALQEAVPDFENILKRAGDKRQQLAALLERNFFGGGERYFDVGKFHDLSMEIIALLGADAAKQIIGYSDASGNAPLRKALAPFWYCSAKDDPLSCEARLPRAVDEMLLSNMKLQDVIPVNLAKIMEIAGDKKTLVAESLLQFFGGDDGVVQKRVVVTYPATIEGIVDEDGRDEIYKLVEQILAPSQVCKKGDCRYELQPDPLATIRRLLKAYISGAPLPGPAPDKPPPSPPRDHEEPHAPPPVGSFRKGSSPGIG